MGSLIWLAIGVAVLFVIIGRLWASQGRGTEDGPWPLYPKKPLSNPEQVLYHRLVEALPDHIVLAQVQLSRFLGVKKGNNFRAWLNRINRMSADYVICTKDASVVAVIELDDATHDRPDRQSSDSKKEKAIGSAGLRLVRWNVKSIPDVSRIRVEITPAVGADTFLTHAPT